MIKTFKALISATLALVLAFVSFSAFAAEEKPVLLWSGIEYTYAGMLAEGENTVELPNEDSFYYTFNAEKAGYYVVSYYWEEIGHFSSPIEAENGIAEGWREIEYLNYLNDDYNIDSILLYFDEGENILASWIGYNAVAGDSSDIEIVFYGETISDISFEGGSKFGLVPEYNIYEYYDYEDLYSGYSYTFDGGATEIVFDTEKTISLPFVGFVCSSETEIEAGENEVVVYYLDNTFKKTISVYPVSKYITNIEVVDIEKYLDVAEGYDGQLLYDFIGMEMILTYADGHTEKVTVEGDSMGIDLLNGNPHYFPLNYYYSCEGDGVSFIITLGDEEFVHASGMLREATGRENRQHLNYVIYTILEETAYDIRYELDRLSRAENLWESIICFRRSMFNCVDEIFYCFEEIISEFGNYLQS